jgi:hypothetical protein
MNALKNALNIALSVVLLSFIALSLFRMVAFLLQNQQLV